MNVWWLLLIVPLSLVAGMWLGYRLLLFLLWLDSNNWFKDA
jgi:hypothetical protein